MTSRKSAFLILTFALAAIGAGLHSRTPVIPGIDAVTAASVLPPVVFLSGANGIPSNGDFSLAITPGQSLNLYVSALQGQAIGVSTAQSKLTLNLLNAGSLPSGATFTPSSSTAGNFVWQVPEDAATSTPSLVLKFSAIWSWQSSALTGERTITLTVKSAAGSSNTSLGLINDTGVSKSECTSVTGYLQTTCIKPAAKSWDTEQDGLVGRDANPATNSNLDGYLGFSFTRICNNGSQAGTAGCPANPKPGSAANNLGCVQDNVTGLYWEIRSPDAPGGWTARYTNFSTTYNPNGLLNGPLDAGFYIQSVNQKEKCGFADWRLPSVIELQGLYDYGTGGVDKRFLPDVQADRYWTSDNDSNKADGENAWVVMFSSGSTANSAFRFHQWGALRLVHGTPFSASDKTRFTISSDGQSVTDAKTALIWQRCSAGTQWSGGSCVGTPACVTYDQAVSLAAAQRSATGFSWRIPNIKELGTLVDVTTNNPAINVSAFPSTSSSGYWSDTPTFTKKSAAFWYVDFGLGITVLPDYPSAMKNCVRLVRNQ
jgi:Protein of unknown function (DUF1566)